MVVDTRVGPVEETLESSKEHTSAPGSKVVSKDAEIAAKIVQAHILEGHAGTEEGGDILMSTTIDEHGPQLQAAEVPRSTAEVALSKAEFAFDAAQLRPHDVREFELSLWKKMSQLQSDNTSHERQYELEPRPSTVVVHKKVTDSANKANRNLRERQTETYSAI